MRRRWSRHGAPGSLAREDWGTHRGMTEDAAAALLVTHLTDAVDPRPEERDGLRVGHPVQLRPVPGSRVVEA